MLREKVDWMYLQKSIDSGQPARTAQADLSRTFLLLIQSSAWIVNVTWYISQREKKKCEQAWNCVCETLMPSLQPFYF